MAKKRANGEGCITKKSGGYWEARIIIKNPMTGERELKTHCRKTQAEVRAWLEDIKAKVAFGKYTPDSSITVGEWVSIWLAEYAKPKVRTTTWESYESTVRNHIIPDLGKILLRDLSPDMVQRLYNRKMEGGRTDGKGGLSSTSVGYIHAVLSGALKRAMRNGIVSRNVTELIDKPRKVRKEILPLTLDELRRFIVYIKGTNYYAAFLLECYTGLRRGELLALRWKDIDFDNRCLAVRQGLVRTKQGLSFNRPKTDASRRSIPLNDNIVAELKSHRVRQAEERLAMGSAYESKDLIFCNHTGKPLDPRSFTKNFQGLLEKAGLPKVRFHDMRHTHATLLIKMGENPKVVQERLGHSTTRMTLDTYSHVLPGMQEEATKRLTDALNI